MDIENSDRIASVLNAALQDPSLFSPGNCHKIEEVFGACLKLFERDNICTILTNENGTLCGTYPGKMILPLKQLDAQDESRKDDIPSEVANKALKQYKELTAKGRLARTRGRFPVPAVLIGNKYICRSSTLAGSPEMYLQQNYHYWAHGEVSAAKENESSEAAQVLECPKSSSVDLRDNLTEEHSVHFNTNDSPDTSLSFSVKKNLKNPLKLLKQFGKPASDDDQNDWLLVKMRKTDIDVLHKLKVNVIYDLMVENKKVKYGVNVTSSEKADSLKRYEKFQVVCVPYPGCEFFTDYSRNDRNSVGMQFDWKQSFIDAELQVPNDDSSKIKGVDWKSYMDWDLVHLTQNYLKLMLNGLVLPHSSGTLVHCISGWDRTPLFVSLLRLSLWADGLIHQSLNAEEIVYLTVAYDWLMFSHQFYNRITKSEEIMHFCFDFLQFIVSEEYSVLPQTMSMSSPFFYIDDKDTTVNSSSERNWSFLDSSFEENEKPQCLQPSAVSNEGNKSMNSTGSAVSENADLCSSGQSKSLHLNGTGSNQHDSDVLKLENSTTSPSVSHDIREENNQKSVDKLEDVTQLLQDSSINHSNSFASSNASAISNGISFSSPLKKENEAVLNFKLETRRRKLLSARDIFIPAYRSVVPKHMEMQQGSGLSGLVGSLGASFVSLLKRS